jgi:hypothetical protein
MTKFNAETIARWVEKAERYVIDNHGIHLTGVKIGSDAWGIAHRSGITAEAYKDRSVVDAHIVTALKQIFPNAVFKDKYSY